VRASRDIVSAPRSNMKASSRVAVCMLILALPVENLRSAIIRSDAEIGFADVPIAP
jgi:hypothetical protein